ncbi:MAG: hypothetical protein IPK99_13925 [Flavobacteriales bacterium]|nr:hypothetical protein [Flavobacteriales bacterium]
MAISNLLNSNAPPLGLWIPNKWSVICAVAFVSDSVTSVQMLSDRRAFIVVVVDRGTQN